MLLLAQWYFGFLIVPRVVPELAGQVQHLTRNLPHDVYQFKQFVKNILVDSFVLPTTPRRVRDIIDADVVVPIGIQVSITNFVDSLSSLFLAVVEQIRITRVTGRWQTSMYLVESIVVPSGSATLQGIVVQVLLTVFVLQEFDVYIIMNSSLCLRVVKWHDQFEDIQKNILLANVL